MSFQLNTIQIRDDLTDLLKNNLSIINTNLTREISNVNKIVNIAYTNNYPFNSSELPQISVIQLGKPNEEFVAIGAGGRKEVFVNFEIVGYVKDVKTSKIDTTYLDNCIHMANNVDYVLRENIVFSSYILESNPQTYELILNSIENGTYICMFRTEVICKCDVVKCLNC
jgi:hypothetical protein